MKVVARLTSNRLPELSGMIQARAEQIVAKASFDVQGEAVKIVPVETGNLKGSIGVNLEKPLEGLVSTGVEYAEYVEYVEYGTSRRAAHPYMTPAAETVRPAWHAAWRQLLG